MTLNVELFKITNFRGDSFTFGNLAGVHVVAHDGLGMPSVQRVLQEGPYQHGATQINARLQPRVITLSLANLRDDAFGGSWTKRDNLLAMLNDISRPLYLDVQTPVSYFADNNDYRMDVYYLDSLTMPRAGEHDGFDRYVLQFIAHDPVWYDPEPVVITMSVTTGGEGLEIPMEIPFGLGGSVVDVTEQFLYPGTWLSYPIIRITGPIEDAVLTAYSIADESQTVKLSFDGVTIAAGDYYEIDCRYGYKTVVDKTGANKIGDLTSDSDLATFCIAPHPYFQDGANQFILTGTSGTVATACTITYYNRYIGI